jgi:periplasmic copper chaperone A
LRNSILCAGLIAALAGAAAEAHAPKPAASAIMVSGAWSRPEPAGLPTGVIYLTVANHGRTADTLMGASSPKAAEVGLHRSMVSGGMASMAMIKDGLSVPAGGTARLEPNGYHLMMMGLKGGLAAGSSFPAVLRFAHAGEVRVTVQVRATAPE